MMLKSDGNKCDFYLGVRSLNPVFSTGRMRDMLENILKGMFPGSCIEQHVDDDMKSDMMDIFENKNGKSNSVSCMTCVADFKQEQERMINKEFIQGLEKFVESMCGKAYTDLLMTDSVSYDSLSSIKNEFLCSIFDMSFCHFLTICGSNVDLRSCGTPISIES